MDAMPALNMTEFEKALTTQRIRAFQIISLALLMGCTLFLGIILFLYATEEPAETASNNSILPILSIVHGGMALTMYIPAFLVGRYFAGPRGLMTRMKNAVPTVAGEDLTVEVLCIGAMFMGFIFRAAILEGMALFGLIVCLMGVLEGQIQSEPVYWGNLFSYIVFAVVTLWTFPTKDRLENLFRERFLQNDFRV